MSPLWGFRVFAYPVRYKHAAPLGLNAKTGKRENGIVLIRIGIVGTTIVVPYNSFAVAVPPRLWVVVIRHRYKHAAPMGLSAKTGKRGNGIVLIRISIVGTTIVVPYNSFAVAVPPRLWVVVIRHCYTHRPDGAINRERCPTYG